MNRRQLFALFGGLLLFSRPEVRAVPNDQTMVKLSSVAADVDLIEAGVWKTYHEGMRFRIASNHCKLFRHGSQELNATGARIAFITDEPGGNPERTKAFRSLMSDTLVMDWEGMEDDDGTAIPYSKDRAREIFTDPRYVDLIEWVWQVAQDLGNYVEQAKHDQAKNSPTV